MISFDQVIADNKHELEFLEDEYGKELIDAEYNKLLRAKSQPHNKPIRQSSHQSLKKGKKLPEFKYSNNRSSTPNTPCTPCTPAPELDEVGGNIAFLENYTCPVLDKFKPIKKQKGYKKNVKLTKENLHDFNLSMQTKKQNEAEKSNSSLIVENTDSERSPPPDQQDKINYHAMKCHRNGL